MSGGGNGNGEALGRLLAEMAAEGEGDWRELARAVASGRRLSSRERSESMARLGRAMREAGVLNEADAHFVVAHSIMDIADDRLDAGDNPALNRLSAEMEAVQERHGLEDDEYWPKGEGPEEYQALQKEWDRIENEIIAATFDEYGENEIGNMYRFDRDRFDRLFEEGRHRFFGASPRRK